jgi:hypothetical protein
LAESRLPEQRPQFDLRPLEDQALPQRAGDPPGIGPCEHAALEIERIASLAGTLGPPDRSIDLVAPSYL